MNRREALAGCSNAIARLTGGQLTGLSFEDHDDDDRDIFVYVFLRGGCDGLSMVAPTDDSNYQAARSGDLSVTNSGSNKGHLMKNPLEDIGFAFHKNAAGLSELYQDNSLAVIHASGLTNATRSHFEAMDLIERGTSSDKSLKKGWITRYLEQTGWTGNPAYAIGGSAPMSFLGYPNVANMANMEDFRMHWGANMPNVLQELYAGNTLIHNAGKNALKVLDTVNQKVGKNSNGDFKKYIPDASAKYLLEWPGEELGKSLATVAQLVKSDVGLKVATVDFGGWDHHESQSWRFDSMTTGLSRSLLAFYNDLHKYHSRLSIVVMSEFGRRLKSNNSRGTDHGHGNAMYVLGGNVKGGKMYGQWPGLEVEQLDNGVDLAITTDYRTVLTEMLDKRLKTPQVSNIFPKYDVQSPLNIFKG